MTIERSQAEAVEDALAALLAWPEIARSPQLAAFLDHVVRARLDGREEQIKAYSIAVDVFGRPTSFDPQQDPIVRVQARRLRHLLMRYHRDVAPDAPVVISLPTGRYVPDFQFGASPAERSRATAPIEPVRPPRRLGRLHVAVGALGLLAAALAVALWASLGGQQTTPPGGNEFPRLPRVVIAPLQAAPDTDDLRLLANALGVELASDLQLFDDLQAGYDGATDADFRIGGVVRPAGQVNLSLTRPGSSGAIWSHSVTFDRGADVDAVSLAFAERLGDARGPLHAAAQRFLVSWTIVPAEVTPYLCIQLHHHWRQTALANDRSRTGRCVALAMAAGEAPLMQAISAAVAADHLAEQRIAGEADAMIAAGAEALSRTALTAAGTSSFVWEQRAWVLAAIGRPVDAEAAFRAALQLNPAAVDARAGLAELLLTRGASDEGRRLAAATLAALPDPPAWYRRAPALDALRRGEDTIALAEAEILMRRDSELAATIAAVAARRLGRQDEVGRFLSQVLAASRYKSYGIAQVLSARIADDALVALMLAELRAAGVPESVINGQDTDVETSGERDG